MDLVLYFIIKCGQGGRGQNPQKFADVLYVWSPSAKTPEFFTPNLIASTSDGTKFSIKSSSVGRSSHLRQYVFKYGVQIRIANIALFRFFLPFAATYFPRVCCHTFFAPVILRRKIIAGCHKKAFLQEW